MTQEMFRPIPATGKMPAVAVFDLDKTLIDGDATLAWTEFLYEKGVITDPRFREINKAMVRSYHAGTLVIQDWLREASQAYTNLPVSEIETLVDTFITEKIAPCVYPEAMAHIRAAKEAGMELFIISASCQFFVAPIGRRVFGIEKALGIMLHVENGHLTPEIEGIPTFQEGKIERLKAELAKIGHTLEETVFFTDSRNDIPLALAAGDCECVNPDHKLRETAMKKRWRVNYWMR